MTQKDYNKEFEKLLRKAIFPQHLIAEEVISHSFTLFHGRSLQQLGMNVSDYRETIAAISDEKMNLYQVSHILNNLPGLSAKELGLTINGYTDLMSMVETMAEVWNSEMRPIQNKLVDEMNRETANLGKQSNKAVNPNLRKS